MAHRPTVKTRALIAAESAKTRALIAAESAIAGILALLEREMGQPVARVRLFDYENGKYNVEIVPGPRRRPAR